MARRADNIAWRLIRDPFPGRLAFAIRLALICSLATAVAEVYQTPEIALTVYLAFFLNKPDRTSSMLLTVAVTILVSVIIGILLLLAAPVLGSPGLRVLAMAAISFAMLFLASASKLKPLASSIALILAYALDVIGSAPLGEAATRALLYAWLFVAIPALVSAVVNLLIAPSPRSIVQTEMAERLRAAARRLGADGNRADRDQVFSIAMGDEEIQVHLKLAGLEKTSSAEDMAALKGASDCLVTVLAAVQLMLDQPEALPPAPIRKKIESSLLDLASIFAAGGYPAKVDPVPTDETCSSLAVSAVEFLNRGLTQFGNVRPEPRPGKSESSEKKEGFFLPDAFTNPLHAQFALKVTAAAMLCYVLYSILSWPGIHTALITCFIVSLGTAAESVEKLTLRIVGCLIGAGLGLLVMVRVIPSATDIGHLLVLVFLGAFLGAWIAGGDRRISYAGFQIAFAYFLCVIQGPSPSFNMVVARDRIIGILLGNIVSYFVATRVWPISVGPRISSALGKVSATMEGIREAPDGWLRRRLAAETSSMLEQISSDIHLAEYEPERIRPPRTRLVAQQAAVSAARKLAPSLLGMVETANDGKTDPGTSLSVPANECSPEAGPVLATVFAPLHSLVRARIAAFQQALCTIAEVEQDA